MGASQDQLKILLEKCSKLAMMKDTSGQLPLHAAVKGESTFSDPSFHETVECLLKAYPGAVRNKDNAGMTPFELACENDVSLSIIYQLIRVDPIDNLGLGAGS